MCSRERIGGGIRAGGLFGKVGGEPFVEALDRDFERATKRSDELLGFRGLLAVLAAHRQGEADDDSLCALRPHQLDERCEPVFTGCVGDNSHRPGNRARRIGDRHPGSCRAEVEREDFHSIPDAICVFPTSYASGRPSGFLPPASARFGRPPPPPPIFFAASRATATAS